MVSVSRQIALATCLLALVFGRVARADAPLVTLEGSGAVALTAPQSDRFGFGGALAVSGYYALAPFALIGAKLRAGFLSDGATPTNAALEDPGIGTLETATALLRLRPFGSGEANRAHGLFVEGGPSGALTGTLVRPAFEAAIGYGIPVSSFSLAPTLRYVQVVQPTDDLSSEDARVLMFGIEMAVIDASPAARSTEGVAPPVEQAKDLDEDGVPDEDDACGDKPEDRDGFQDQDGCPDPDNDADGMLDASDKCPNEAEDVDGFEDEDGCPEPDNDDDTFLDADDQCPNDPEVINGNLDYDGCPDEGLIEMVNDRIVLEERVLFDVERARIKTAAKPILDAIVKLFSQHPEWIKIRIEGHADSRGDAQYNLELSQRRAENVRKEIARLGIPEGIIDAVGFGAEKPRDLREDEEGFHRNRRVEFVVVARSQAHAAPPATKPAPAAKPAPAPPATPEAAAPAPPAPVPAAQEAKP
jgi:outer membrane protein OmpA-like peptidoglycan-associated protein